LAGNPAAHVEASDLVDLLAFTKSSHWAYEAEWRFAYTVDGPESPQFEYHSFERSAIRRVRLGCWIGEEEESAVRAAASRYTIPVVKLRQSPTAFGA